MTRRQIYFYNPVNQTYYVSDEFNGDRSEFELRGAHHGSGDYCDKDWPELMKSLNNVQTLSCFMSAIAKISGSYHSILGQQLPGVRLNVKHSHDALEPKDEAYGIVAGTPGYFLDKELSIYGDKEYG